MKSHFFTLFLVLLLDQISKYYVITYHYPYLLNPGIAFSIPLANSIVSIIVIIVIFWLYNFWLNLRTRSLVSSIAMGMIVGGALGNLVDRIHLGAVIDFIKVPYWPTFNVADSAVSIGVILLIWVMRTRNKTKNGE